jgi:hypothetical protein
VNIIAIVGHNLTSNATITVKAGSSEDPSDSIGTISWRKGTAFVYLDALQLAQYFKLEIEDASNPDGFIDIGYICIGALTELDFTFAYGSRYSHKVAGLGDLRGDSLEIRRHLSDSTDLDLKFQNLYVTDANILRTIFQDNLGPTVPFLFIPDTTDSDCVFGRWTGEFTKQFTYTNLMNVDISIVGDATPTPISESPIIVLPGKSMPIGYNFNRASTARSKDADLRLITTTSGVIRDAYYFNQETCGILIEPDY